uniref:Uncharacterized protein n=1 Tax=Cyanoderma ruficeps TaxID=181631 RepID=A0A8C3QJ82_9PASS
KASDLIFPHQINIPFISSQQACCPLVSFPCCWQAVRWGTRPAQHSLTPTPPVLAHHTSLHCWINYLP